MAVSMAATDNLLCVGRLTGSFESNSIKTGSENDMVGRRPGGQTDLCLQIYTTLPN